MHKTLLILLIVLATVSCKKSDRDEDVLTNTSTENAFAEAIFADAFKIVNKAALNAQGISRSLTTDTTQFGCDIITVDTTTNPKLLVIDYRFKGCVATHGVSRKGRIIAEVTGIYPEKNSIINLQFLNYNFGNYKIDGNLVIVNRGLNENGFNQITFFMQDGTISDDRGTITWQANKTWEFIEGMNTLTISDDKYSVTGTSFGFNSKGNEFDAEVETPNVINQECFQFVAGTLNLNIDNLSIRKVNYGQGNCDREAVVNINGKDHQVTLLQ